MHANTRRGLRIVPLAVVLALAVGACGSPWAKGTNATSTSSTAANNAANNTAGNTGNSADLPSVAVSVPGGDTAVAAAPAPGAPAADPGANPGAANPAPPAPANPPAATAPTPAAVAPTGGDSLPAADALAPSAQAEYCKRTNPLDVALPSEDGVRQSTNDLKTQAQIWTDLAPFTPAGLRGDTALLANDYRAFADGSRTLPQADGEVRTSYRRVMDYRNLICLTEEERQRQAGN